MSGMPKLENAPIGLGALREQARDSLMAALDSVSHAAPRGEGFALVLDPSLSGPLGLIAEVREFREHGVDKIYHLMPEPLQLHTCRSRRIPSKRPLIGMALMQAAML